ncbi:unnamed protein product [Fraxinus pennsylvanica]|uniref:2-hydroxyacyl-CoA lyase n=1 Tax=Fraxinus pennsylvanica TaxID=56036 RepID=A0AAD1YVW2_9LAMI|nr:unnamed protein product [Fraxinus pennsylvanica]
MEDADQERSGSLVVDGNTLVAMCLAHAGVDRMFGVVGIPVTSLANRDVALGVRVIDWSVAGRPGGTYLDLPTDVLYQTISESEAERLIIQAGAAYARAENALRKLVESTGIPILPIPMGKGLLSDDHQLAATAARSMAIGKCDVALVVGAWLNWLLHFGEPPKWSKDVKFILVDIYKDEIELRKPTLGILGDAKDVLEKLHKEINDGPFCLGKTHLWVEAIKNKVKENVAKMEVQLANEVMPFNFLTPMKIIRDAILGMGSPAPILVSEGANTMDVGRSVLVQIELRTRLDVGTWGTMGVGLGYCIAAVVASPDRLVVAVEGDSGFGFSAMEVEVLVRYQLPMVVVVFNNGGVYGGERRNPDEITGPYKDDPAPTSFVPGWRSILVLLEAFGGKGYLAGTPDELKTTLAESFSARRPTVINVTIDPYAGVESGRLHHKN